VLIVVNYSGAGLRFEKIDCSGRNKNKKDRLKNLSFPLKSAFVNQIQIYEKKSITNIVYYFVKEFKIKLIDVKLFGLY